ncbi:VOC family protein [Primorskyibacter sp. 2E107]|uniref:VOC family protein n=1 Tax=Primorskyibacter sp. 2E107 TaxID=3403458 RepID=UPI003AF73592
MQTVQAQGVHHITLVGANRQSSIDFWEGVLGMPFVFEQPNLDDPEQSHLYFDPGDGRLITIFTAEDRTPDRRPTPTEPGCVHHIAFNISRANWLSAKARLEARGISVTARDRGFMDSLYFRDPLGLTIELASYKFEPPFGRSHTEVLHKAHLIRVEQGDQAIETEHVALAIDRMGAERDLSLSTDRTPKNPFKSKG